MVNNLSEALLAFLLTLYRTGSMKSTALRLGISASTASYNLKAARAIFCDELFLRTGNGMVPTTHMVGIAPKIESALLVLKDLTASDPAPFSPAEATDVFRLGCVDNVYPALLAPVLPKLLEAAPGLRLEIVEQGPDLIDRMRRGEVVFAFRATSPFPSDFHESILYRSNYSLLTAADHPLVALARSKGMLSYEDIRPYRQVQARVQFLRDSSTIASGLFPEEEEPAWAIRTRSFLAGPLILPGTRLTFRAPTPSAMLWAQHPHLARLRVDYLEARRFVGRLVWHERVDKNPAHQWLRSFLLAQFPQGVFKLR